MNDARRQALSRLAQTDRRIAETGIEWLTLDPARARASSLESIGRALFDEELAPSEDEADAGRLMLAFAAGLEHIALAQLEHFPENLLWDFDYIAASVWKTACASAHGVSTVDLLEREITALQALFGHRSPIRFRYVHDFVYGWDWERWVARDPRRHAAVGPFDATFLERIQRRAAEITAAIESGDDPAWPRLSPGAFRNPFAFSRDPHDELRLQRALAARDCVPVRSWRIDAQPTWAKPFSQLRIEVARELGIPR